MDKLAQLVNAILCLSELDRAGKREHRSCGIGEVLDSLINRIVFMLILSVGIFMGLIHIPAFLGDGYSFDNFNRKEGDAPEHNLHSVFF
jgi:hypothetical protein